METLTEDVSNAIDETLENFFGETFIRFIDNDDYNALFNQLLDMVKR